MWAFSRLGITNQKKLSGLTLIVMIQFLLAFDGNLSKGPTSLGFLLANTHWLGNVSP